VRHHAWVRSKTSGGLLSVLTLLVATLASAPPAVTHNSDNHPPDDIYIPAGGNGWKIYLSPAHHWTGPNYGCDNYVEDDNMPLVALYAGILGSGGDGSLYDRGYSVRLGRGDPDDNVMRANAWGSDRYIALHSNAMGDAQCGAGAAGAGTWAYYRPGSFREPESGYGSQTKRSVPLGLAQTTKSSPAASSMKSINPTPLRCSLRRNSTTIKRVKTG
jgi:hypothetical protein